MAANIEELIEVVLHENASDLHIAEGRHPTIRSAGYLTPLAKYEEVTKEETERFVDHLLTPENKKLLERDKQVDFAFSYQNKARFRGNIYYQQGYISIALRLIPTEIRSLEELNLPSILESFAQREQGFFLVVGPTGEGKSTTLATLIDQINTNRLEHIITVEDPVEYVHEQKKSIVEQRQVRTDTPDFHTALKGVFRQDVDVIMVGEMRDPQTIATAVTAAETGHLIYSTLHTNTASQTIDRIIDSFPPSQQGQIRLQLASSLAGIFSQRLIPRISGGLVPAYELLINNNAISNLIREARTHEVDTVIETSSEIGMINMNSSLAELVRQGEITVESAYQYSTNPKALERMI